MALLVNRVDKKVLKKRLEEETFKRITVSFYRYVIIDEPAQLRDELWKQWNELNVFGRIYLAREGINAQLCVPEKHWDVFREKYMRITDSGMFRSRSQWKMMENHFIN